MIIYKRKRPDSKVEHNFFRILPKYGEMWLSFLKILRLL